MESRAARGSSMRAGRCDRAPLPLPPARHRADLRVQRQRRAGVAPDGVHDEVVRGRLERCGDARGPAANSIVIALVAAAVALVLGSLAAFAVHRFRFFGRETISFALVLPIALPGIITAMALSSAIEHDRHHVLAVDDHDRPRDLLRRRGVQQRDREAPADARDRSSRRRWTWAPTAGRRSGT